MSEKYDGWCVKSYWEETPSLISCSFGVRRIDVIKYWEADIPGLWRKQRRMGMVKCVKVRLVEVE